MGKRASRRNRRSKSGVTDTVITAILLAVTVAAGIAIWLYSLSRSEVISVKINEDNNAAIMQVGSTIKLEHYTLSSGGLGKLWIRNIGNIPIVVTRFQIFSLDGSLLLSTDFTCITILDVGELSDPDTDDAECIALGSTALFKTTKFTIPPTVVDEGVILYVYILAKELYDANIPQTNQDRAVVYSYYLKKYG